MTTGSVIEDFDVFEDGALGFVEGLELKAVDQLVLQRVPEALGNGVVVAAPTAPGTQRQAPMADR